MDKYTQLILSINELPLGITDFEFEIGDWFFEKFEYSEIKQGKIKVDLSLDKQERMYFLHFQLSGHINLTCDRCGDNYNQPVNGKESLIIKLGSKDFEDNDDIVVMAEHDQHFDITQYLYEYLSLMVPMQHLHPADSKGQRACNKEAIKILEKLSADNKKTNETDPRWDKLKKLKFND